MLRGRMGQVCVCTSVCLCGGVGGRRIRSWLRLCGINWMHAESTIYPCGIQANEPYAPAHACVCGCVCKSVGVYMNKCVYVWRPFICVIIGVCQYLYRVCVWYDLAQGLILTLGVRGLRFKSWTSPYLLWPGSSGQNKRETRWVLKLTKYILLNPTRTLN